MSRHTTMHLPTPVAAAIFWGLQIISLPLLVTGYVLFVVKMLVVSRKSRTSQTVLAAFFTRWMQHQLGTRRDVPCVRLMRVLPNVSRLGLRLFTRPIILAHRLTGYVPRTYRYPYPGVPPMNDEPAARVTFFDQALARHLPDIDQLVVLGAGLDTRSYLVPPGASVRCFEVDTPWTQPFKRAMLKHAGIDSHGVTYVAADFEQEDWFEKLVAAGFDPNRPSFFLWEGVTPYLDRPAVESTLRKIASTAPGSAVSFDYFSNELLVDQSLFWRYARLVLNAVGEPMGSFGLAATPPPARKHAAAFVESCGLALEEHRNFGQETAEKHPQAGFLTAVVGPRAI
jgi:methyltransferase (TIGR00027 family)